VVIEQDRAIVDGGRALVRGDRAAVRGHRAAVRGHRAVVRGERVSFSELEQSVVLRPSVVTPASVRRRRRRVVQAFSVVQAGLAR